MSFFPLASIPVKTHVRAVGAQIINPQIRNNFGGPDPPEAIGGFLNSGRVCTLDVICRAW